MYNMSESIEEKKENHCDSPLDKSRYPLKIYIDKDMYKKLHLSEVPTLESKMKLVAVVEVSNVSSEKMLGDEGNYSMTLTVNEMELIPNSEHEEKANSFYGAE